MGCGVSATRVSNHLVDLPTIHITWRVPKAEEAEIDAYWKGHEAWMRSSHTMGARGDDSKAPRLLEFYVSKGLELKNPLCPAMGETGNVIYQMSETYVAPQGIAKHLELGTANWPGMKSLGDLHGVYGVFMEIGSLNVITCWQDAAVPFTTEKGQPCIHITWRVPKAKEVEIDAYWKEHEAWMRSSHTMGIDGDDSKAPRLTSFYIAKGMELQNPLDVRSGETGNVIYQMSQTYAAPQGIAKHLELGTANWPGMKSLGDLHGKYGVFMEIGTTKVFTNLSEPSLVGSPTIHVTWRVPKAEEAEIDAYWKEHEAWMRSSHTMGLDGDDSKAPRLLEFYISKGMELENPPDPESGETGNVIYQMSQTYAARQGIAKHLELGTANWPGMKSFGDLHGKYGVFMQIGSLNVITCWQDAAIPFTTDRDQPCMHITWRAPKAKEAEIDAFWKEHEAWMRSSHTMGIDGDDNLAPRLTAFYIAKGMELQNPLDPESGETGNVIYQMSETYAAPQGMAKHLELGKVRVPCMKSLGDLHRKYGVFMEIGTTKVFTNLSEPSLVGSPTIHITWSVPKSEETEIDAYWKEHEAWMRSSHTMGLNGDDSKAPRLLEFYISKSMELQNPSDPASGETGNMIYQMSETYDALQGIAKNLELGTASRPGMKSLGDLHGEYGVFMQIGSLNVITCWQDAAVPFTTDKDQQCTHSTWRVPKAKEAEIDAYWKEHEAWMRSSHTMGIDGDDSSAPRLTSFCIAKGMELQNPSDPASGETGNVIYQMSETYGSTECSWRLGRPRCSPICPSRA
ncbi:unnamed protein product [Polarella glacialis]|uniref:Uncharacterized protein n=1 Tax=Polarella glacialis TaxID=89957 RepID=A0A813J5L4_POLGL|nr:unnamed protein product [Polarella glacialis]